MVKKAEKEDGNTEIEPTEAMSGDWPTLWRATKISPKSVKEKGADQYALEGL